MMSGVGVRTDTSHSHRSAREGGGAGGRGGGPTELNDDSLLGLGLLLNGPDGASSKAVLRELGVVWEGGGVGGRGTEDGWEEGRGRGRQRG